MTKFERVLFYVSGAEQGLTGASLGSPWFSGASLGKQHPWSFLTTRLCGGHHA